MHEVPIDETTADEGLTALLANAVHDGGLGSALRLMRESRIGWSKVVLNATVSGMILAQQDAT